MRYTFLFLIFLSCMNGGQLNNEASLAMQTADTVAFNDSGIQQQLIVVNRSVFYLQYVLDSKVGCERGQKGYPPTQNGIS